MISSYLPLVITEQFQENPKLKGIFIQTLYCFGTKAFFDRHKTIGINDVSKILSLFGSPLAKDYCYGYNSKWTENDFILFWNVTTEIFSKTIDKKRHYDIP